MKKLLVAIAALSAFLLIASIGLGTYVTVQASSAKNLALAKLKTDVAYDLHDPDSVRFRDLKLTSDSDHLESLSRFVAFIQENEVSVLKMLQESPAKLFSYREEAFALCGQLNAKNRMGAYVGYTDFYVRRYDPPKVFVAIESLGWDKASISDMCNRPVVFKPTDE